MNRASKPGVAKGMGSALRKHVLSLLALLLSLLWSQWLLAAQSLPFALPPPFIALQALTLAPGDRQWLEKRQRLRVGISIADYEPIDIATDRNRFQGISADYLSLIGSTLNIPLHVIGFAERDEAIHALRNGTIDILSSAKGFERAGEGLAFSRDYMPDRSVVVGRGPNVHLPAALKGRKVVLLDGYAHDRVVQAAYPDSEIILAPNLFSALEALSQAQVDAFIGNEVVVRSYIALRPHLDLHIHFESALPPMGFSFAVRDGEHALLSMINRALDSLGPSIDREILERWTLGLGSDVGAQRMTLSGPQRAWIRRHPSVTVVSSQHPPYIYKDKSGRWVGLNVDVLARISRLTGLQFVHKEVASTQATIDVLRSAQADMNTTLGENTERRQFLDFTYAFGGNNWVFILPQGSPKQLALKDLEGRVLALPARHVLEESIRLEHPQIQLRLVGDYEEARQLVANGQAAATIQNEAGAYLLLPDALKVGPIVDGRWSPDRFSVIKSQPELLSILNQALEEFPVAQLRAIRLKWLGSALPRPSVWHRIPDGVYWLVALALSIGLVSLVWNRRLNVQIAQRRQAELALSDQLAFKQALLNGIPNPVYVRDLQGRLIACNRSYEESFGVSFEQMSGRRLIDVESIPRSSAQQLHADYLTLLETQRPVSVDRSMQLFGKEIEARHWTVPFFGADGQMHGLVGGWIDISEHKRLLREPPPSGKPQPRHQ